MGRGKIEAAGRLARKAAEDCRTPKAGAFSHRSRNSRSIVECGPAGAGQLFYR